MNTSVAFLCVQPAEAVAEKAKSGNGKSVSAKSDNDKQAQGGGDKQRTGSAEASKTKNDKQKNEKANSDRANSTKDEVSPRFVVKKSFVDETRAHVTKHIGTMIYGFVPNEVIEVPHKVEDLRKWICETHQSQQIGYFEIETLVIPMMRGAGLEHSRDEKDQLFEVSQLETIYLSVDQGLSGRLPLNDIGCTGKTSNDMLMASRFARRFANARVVRFAEGETEPEQKCVVAALEGKAYQTRIDKNSTWNKIRKTQSLPVAMMLNPADAIHDRVAVAIDDKIRYWFSAYQLSREDRVRLSGKLESGAASSPEFILFMSVATFLACIGLIQDSAAVIIGAMLVAPLMTPLLGAGLALIFGNKPLFGKAVKSILLGVAIAFLIGTLVGLFSLCVPPYLMSGSGLCLTGEMISRSQPNVLDPFIGLAAGLAGGFAIGRDGQIGTVAGVAIAAALVPPIATAGLEASLAIYCTFAAGDPMVLFELLKRDPGAILRDNGLLTGVDMEVTRHVHLISAPLVLFALNACATIIGAFVGLRMVGMHRTSRARHSRSWVYVFIFLLLLAIVCLIVFPMII